jgi:hypothetical protein
MELSDAMCRIEELQPMNYEMLDYLRTQLAWLLEYCKKNRIPLLDFDKAMFVVVTDSTGVVAKHVPMKLRSK